MPDFELAKIRFKYIMFLASLAATAMGLLNISLSNVTSIP